MNTTQSSLWSLLNDQFPAHVFYQRGDSFEYRLALAAGLGHHFTRQDLIFDKLPGVFVNGVVIGRAEIIERAFGNIVVIQSVVQGENFWLWKFLNVERFRLGIGPRMKFCQIHADRCFGFYPDQCFFSQWADIKFVIVFVRIYLREIPFHGNQFADVLDLIEDNVALLDDVSILETAYPSQSTHCQGNDQDTEDDQKKISCIFHLNMDWILRWLTYIMSDLQISNYLQLTHFNNRLFHNADFCGRSG